MIKVLIQEKIYKVISSCTAGAKDGREALNGLHITKKYIEATDGRMLARADRYNIGIPDNTEPGLYKIIGAGKKDKAGFMEVILERQDIQYPDTDAVMPTQTKQADGFKISIRGKKDDILSLSAAIISLYKKTGNGYAGHLLERLTPLNEIWTAGNHGLDKPLRLDCESLGVNITVVAMPFKLSEA